MKHRAGLSVSLAICAILAGVVLLVRHRGLSCELDSSTWLGLFLRTYIGERRFANTFEEVYRGKLVTLDGEHCVIPLVRGDYYTPAGKRISWIRNGCGTRVMYYKDGLDMIEGYANGLPSGPFISFYPDGKVRFYRQADSDSKSHGPAVSFWPDGRLKSVRKYQHGVCLETMKWDSNGVPVTGTSSNAVQAVNTVNNGREHAR